MKSRDAEFFLIERWFSDRSHSAVDQRARKLRDAGMLSAGARGPHSAEIGTADLRNLVLSLASESAADAPRRVHALARFVVKDGKFPAATFGEAFDLILEEGCAPHKVDAVRIAKAFDSAEILLKGRSIVRFGPPDQRAGGFGKVLYDEMVIRARALDALHEELNHPTTSGWAGD